MSHGADQLVVRCLASEAELGDRLAAGSSGAGADELDRLGGLGHGSPFVHPTSYDDGAMTRAPRIIENFKYGV